MNPTFTLAIVLVAAQQPTAPIPSASQPVATPLQARSRPATLLPIDEGFVTSMVYSPDGKTLAAGYARAPNTASGVVLWDVAGRKRVVDKSFPVTEGSVRSVAFSPDGTTLAAGYSYLHGSYRDGGVVLWDVAGRKRVMQAPLPRKGGQVGVVVFSPDGKSLAGVYVGGPSPGGGVVLWDVAGRKLLCQVSPPPPVARIVNVAFSPDGTTLAAAYSYEYGFYTDGGMVLWDVAEHKRVMQAPLPRKVGQVGAVAFSPDGKSLAGVYVVGPRLGGGVVLWDVAGRKRVAQDSLPAIKGWYTSVVFSPEGTTLAAAYSPARASSSDGGMVLWDVAGRKLLCQVSLSLGWIKDVAFSPDGKRLAAVYSYLHGSHTEGGIVLWHVAEHKLVAEESLPVTYGSITCMVLSPDGKTLAAGYSYVRGLTLGDGVLLWDLTSRPRGK